MLPIVVSQSARIGLVGQGDALGRRAATLVESGVRPTLLTNDAAEEELEPLALLFVAGLDEDESRALAVRARALGVLVNVEDRPELCDFHVPGIVRRGDLTLTVSTAGKSPGLARHFREWLATQIGPEWQERIEALSAAREGWRAAGIGPADVSRLTRERIDQEGWLR